MIYAGQFYNNISDALWCQSANNGSNIGLLYYPNGTQVPSFNGNFSLGSILLPAFSNFTITMTWIPPSFTPQTNQGYYQCCRLCEQTFGSSIPLNSISSPYTFAGIDPGTYCIVGLDRIYGREVASLGTGITTTLSSGKLCYILIITIIILFSHYLQHPLHLSVMSLYHQLRQGSDYIMG